MLGLMTNIVQFAWWNCKSKRTEKKTGVPGHWNQYQPCYILLLATVLVVVQPTCMLYIGSYICDGAFTSDQAVDASQIGTVLEYTPAGKLAFKGSSLQAPELNSTYVAFSDGTYYSDGCNPSQQNFFFDNSANPNALTPNTVTGWMIQIFCTYLGFLLMFIGVCQATNLHIKVMKKWASLRGGSTVKP